MDKSQEWQNFLGNLLNNGIEEYKKTQEYFYLKNRYDEIDDILETNLTQMQKCLIDDCLWELGLAADRQQEVLYKQGLKDCVWLLKNLGILA